MKPRMCTENKEAMKYCVSKKKINTEKKEIVCAIIGIQFLIGFLYLLPLNILIKAR